VPQTATDRDIKKAYRQKALKLHPDVNKAPDAEKKFMEVKNAFTVLSNPQQKAEYDRKLRMGSGGWGDFSGWGSTSSSSTSGRRPTQQEEEFYGLGEIIRDATEGVNKWVQQQDLGKLKDVPADFAGWVQEQGDKLQKGGVEQFFTDLEKEFESWSKSKKDSGKPMSLWEELAAVGEELVDYLEDSLGVKEEAGAKSSSKSGSSTPSSSSSSSSSRPKSAVDEYEELLSKLGMKPGSEDSSSSSSSGRASSASTSAPPPPPPPPARKTTDEEVDEMLAALKKKLNKS